ncbi:MAG: hypothetical protein NT120_02695 [Candidatus Aenigmarchaeota archaeon]|nr:hypothetical protein [Candidatus Aenigmarchaeota archaeon]
MGKIYKIKRGDLLFAIIFVFLMGFVIASFTIPQQKATDIPAAVEGEKVVTMGLPAVDADGNGVMGTLITRIRPGTGQILVNINDVLAQFDTQYSGRTAAKAAADFMKTAFINIDITYDIKVNATVIEGPSAGAAMAASIVLGLKGIPSDNSIMMTGTIRDNGTIGPIGSVSEKAKAAKDNGATLFLVPKGQSTEMTTIRTRECRNFDSLEICQIQYKHGETNIGQSLNITVQEVSNLSDIVSYFLKESNQTDVSV